jgi:Rod binding domain-containing protein
MIDNLLPLGDLTTTMGALPTLAGKSNIPTNIDKAANDFEAMFATQLLQPMFEGLKVNETFGGGHGEEVMKSFLLQEYGKILAKTGKLGIAPQVKAEMLRAQEGARARGDAPSAATAQNAYANATNQGASYVSH